MVQTNRVPRFVAFAQKKEQQPDKYRCCSFFLISAKIAVERLHPGQLSELSPGWFSDPLPEIPLWSQILRLQNAHLPLPQRWPPA